MSNKSKQIAEFGDFQTPYELADEVCRLLAKQGSKPASLLEPTCGIGGFFFAGLNQFKTIQKAVGADINPEYIRRASETLQHRSDASQAELVEANFFATDWQQVVDGLPEPILVLGNLPWVTNAHLTSLGSQNLPVKSNFQKHNGFDAITGKANFDISEWMLIRLLEALNGKRALLAMLCKSAVARKALSHGWKNNIALERSAIYRIDASLHFNAAVDAALLVTHFKPESYEATAKVFPRLTDADQPTTIGYEDGLLFADIDAYHRTKHLGGEEVLKWRSGVKHDCSKVMELRREGNCYRNGLGELVELENAYLYPMLKSSDVAGERVANKDRWMIVTQKTVGQETADIKTIAPKTWAYLTAHVDLLEKRGSSIYRNRPPFSIFGVGDYTFAPWKVAISGFYKRLKFTAVGPIDGKPAVLDDTSYFLPCESEEGAEHLLELLNSSTARDFYNAHLFWDAKRPITADLLRRLNLRRTASEIGIVDRFEQIFGGKSDALTRLQPKQRSKTAARYLFTDL